MTTTYAVNYRSIYEYNADEWDYLLNSITKAYRPWSDLIGVNRLTAIIHEDLRGNLRVTTLPRIPSDVVWLTEPSQLKPLILRELLKP